MIKFPKQHIGSYKRLLGVILSAFVFTETPPVTAQTQIINEASASGDNLTEEVDSNETSLIALQATLELVKTADRAAAEPGDTVIYRLVLRNTSQLAANNLRLEDRLPFGVQFEDNSVEASITEGTTTTEVTNPEVNSSNRTVGFTFPEELELGPDQTLNLVYAAVVTPDAVRGNGRNDAQESRSNIASFTLQIRPGILSDCGTLIGRVFVDKNFDGEQQSGEPGVPNAVIFMDDGNRITTDPNGLFSVANVISGERTGTLDLSSMPGYSLAPNLYFIEGNSQSRRVRLEPGGMARMNFAVTPVYGEEQL